MDGATAGWPAEPVCGPLSVFISYRREDAADAAGRLYDGLVARYGPGSVFIDVDSIDPGASFGEVVAQAVASCDVLLAVIGRQWLTVTDARGTRRLEDPDDLVRLEVKTALDGNARVMPVLVQGAGMPNQDELPDGLKALAGRNALEMTPARWTCDLGRLTAALDKLHQQEISAGEPPRAPLPRAHGTGAQLTAVAVPRQLPAAVAGFAGRVAELTALTRLLEEAASQGGTVVISAIDGTAGIGKTTLAVQWAHQVAGRFPGGQLYVNLRGFDPAGTPMTPAEALRGFLDAFEVPAERVPVSLNAQAGQYRSLLAGRQVLVVLDNARDSDQVRPLLPGAPGCCVVVTSRNHLTGLIADGARPLPVGLLTAADARLMLARRLGGARVAAQPDAVQEIIGWCARLPLALSIVAARAAAHPDFPLAALAGELRDADGRLQALDTGEAAATVTAVFSWSYQQLSDQAARIFRLLGLHPGPDISAPAAASLAAVPVPAARLMLAELARAHLIAEHTPGRFTFHDLLRAYATAQARAHDPGTDRNAAVQRMLDHYLHTAHAAWRLSHPYQQQSIPLAPPLPSVIPEEPAGYPAAWAWFTAEYPVLLAAIQLAAAAGYHTHAWQLPHALTPFFERKGRWHDLAATNHTALTAAQHHADRRGQAHAHMGIGHACVRTGCLGEGRPHLQNALRLFEELGDQAGQAGAHQWLGWTFQNQDRREEALTHLQQAVTLARTSGYRRGLAASLNGLGYFHALSGNAQQALTYCQQSLALFRDLDDRWGQRNLSTSLRHPREVSTEWLLLSPGAG